MTERVVFHETVRFANFSRLAASAPLSQGFKDAAHDAPAHPDARRFRRGRQGPHKTSAGPNIRGLRRHNSSACVVDLALPET